MDNLSRRGPRLKGKDDDNSHMDVYKPRKTSQKITMRNVISHSVHSVKWRVILLSLLVWCLVINFFERSTVKRTIQRCQWNKWEPWTKGDPHRIALFADPQIMDAYSYPDRPGWVNWLTSQLVDNYHRRNWAFVDKVLDPDTVIFLGDLFDGGRNWDDADWYEEFKRFNEIYHKRPNRRTIMSLPGNHDIGFGETVNITSLNRFKSTFGPPSSIHELGNHTVVLLDTISLSDYSNPEVVQDPREILESLAPYDENEAPRLLMTHVPLYRFPDQQPCGPLRESKKKFPIMKGHQYQTVLDFDLTMEVLSKVRPKFSFSGDDHDYCHVQHKYEFQGQPRTADEITVKSCSMNMGIQYPAIELLSLNTEDGGDQTFKVEICYLPPPYAALKGYIVTAIVNAIVLIVYFLLPHLWIATSQRVISRFSHPEFPLPLAEHHTKPIFREKDYIAIVVNGTFIAGGVLSLFGLFFNAFK